MMAAEEMGAARRDERGWSPSSLRPTSALERITVLLRHIDAQLGAVKQEVCSVRQFSVFDEIPDLNRVLGPLEEALSAAADTFGVEPVALDGRRALRGVLHILWADLIDMSPENLRKHWGIEDIPDHWPELHLRLLAAVEGAIAQL